MKKILYAILIAIAVTVASPTNAQEIPDFTNLYDPAVTCYWGTINNPFMYLTVNNDRHKIINEQGTDPRTGGGLSLSPEPEGSNVVRLGNYNGANKAQGIKYRFTVNPDKSILLLKFAVVFKDPTASQSFENRARFRVKVTRPDGELVEENAIFDVATDDLSMFEKTPGYDIWWRDWTSVGIDLSTYIGTEVVVDFFTCDFGSNYGYAYYTVSCIENIFDIEDCSNPITLTAPNWFESYLWNDGTAEQSNTFSVGTAPVNASCTMTSVTGSQFTLFATLSQSDSTMTNDLMVFDTICIDEPYVHKYFRETIIHPETGDYAHINTIVNIMDSADTTDCAKSKVTLRLHVIDRLPDTTVYESICHGEQYTGNDLNIDTDTLQTGMNTLESYYNPPIGCSRMTILKLNVIPSYDSIPLHDEICSGEIYDSLGFFADNLMVGDTILRIDTTTMRGCDSTIYLHLHVNETWVSEIYDTICFGEEYHEFGFDINDFDSTEIGMNHDTLFLQTTTSRCDSTVILNLTVNETFDTMLSEIICFGEDYHGYNFDTIRPAAGQCIIQNVLESKNECDSIVTMVLEVIGADTVTYHEAMCSTGIYNEHGFNNQYDSMGQYYDTLLLKSKLGCDSLLICLDLIVSTTYSDTIYDTIPFGEEYHYDELNIHVLNPSIGHTTIIANPQSIVGCDSLVIVNLYVGKTYDTLFSGTICYGDDYNEHGFIFENPGIGFYRDTLFEKTVLGYDSTVYLELLVAPVYDTLLYDTICYGNGYYEHGFELDPSSIEIWTNSDTLFLATTLGCDSTVRLNLFVAPTPDTTVLSDISCIGEDYILNGFEFLNPDSGWHHGTLELYTIFGCDSIVAMNLFVAPTFDTTLRDTICYGEDYFEHGFQIENPNPGLRRDTLTFEGVFQCDSTLILNLYVAQTYDITFQDTICYGEEYHQHGFDLENLEVGLYDDMHSYNTIFGCDSVVRLNLIVAPQLERKFTDIICFGEDYVKHGFNIIAPSMGVHYDSITYQSVMGCDSIVELSLVVLQSFNYEIYDTICDGGNYTSHGMHHYNMSPGDYEFTSSYQTTEKCDSIYNIHLRVDYIFGDPGAIEGETELFVESGAETGKYQYFIDPIPNCTEYIWEISNSNWEISPDANNCQLTVKTAGTATISVKAGNHCSNIHKELNLTSSYFDISEIGEMNLEIYPNPCKSSINVEGKGIEMVRIINATGTMLKEETYEKADKVTFDLSGIAGSLYLLEVTTSEGRCIRQITIMNH